MSLEPINNITDKTDNFNYSNNKYIMYGVVFSAIIVIFAKAIKPLIQHCYNKYKQARNIREYQRYERQMTEQKNEFNKAIEELANDVIDGKIKFEEIIDENYGSFPFKSIKVTIMSEIICHPKCTIDLLKEIGAQAVKDCFYYEVYNTQLDGKPNEKNIYFNLKNITNKSYFNPHNEEHIKFITECFFDFDKGIKPSYKIFVVYLHSLINSNQFNELKHDKLCYEEYDHYSRKFSLEIDSSKNELLISNRKLVTSNNKQKYVKEPICKINNVLTLHAYKSVKKTKFDKNHISFINEKIIPNIQLFETNIVINFLNDLNTKYTYQKTDETKKEIANCVNKTILALNDRELSRKQKFKLRSLEIKDSKEMAKQIDSNDNYDKNTENAIDQTAKYIVSKIKIPGQNKSSVLIEELNKIKNESRQKETISKITNQLPETEQWLIPTQYFINDEKFAKEEIIKYIQKLPMLGSMELEVNDSRRKDVIQYLSHYNIAKMPLASIKTKKSFMEIFLLISIKYYWFINAKKAPKVDPNEKFFLTKTGDTNRYYDYDEGLRIGVVEKEAIETRGVVLNFYGYKFLLHQMIDDKQSLNNDEFARHKENITFIFTNKQFLNKDNAYYRNDSTERIEENKIPFLTALCNYFSKNTKLATAEQTEEIRELINNNIRNFIDIEKLFTNQRLLLYNVLKKMECEECFNKEEWDFNPDEKDRLISLNNDEENHTHTTIIKIDNYINIQVETLFFLTL